MKKASLAVALAILFALSLAAQTQTNPVKAPPAAAQPEPAKGHLIIIGGGDSLEPILKRFVALADKFQSGKIVVYMMAGGTPMEDGPLTLEDFRKAGAKNVVWANLTHDQALVQDNADALNDVGGVYFEGGDQARLTAALLDTPIHKKIMDLYRKGAVVGGTSAGAAVQSRVMITGDELRKPGGEEVECQKFKTIEAGNIVTAPGFGFVTRAVIDQHFIARKRYGRLISVIAEHPDLLGVAMDENTAIDIGPDETFEVCGASNVIVLDPGQANIQTLPSKLFNIEGMTLHVLAPGTRYSLKDRKVVH